MYATIVYLSERMDFTQQGRIPGTPVKTLASRGHKVVTVNILDKSGLPLYPFGKGSFDGVPLFWANKGEL